MSYDHAARRTTRPGVWLMIVGAVVALAVAIFALAVSQMTTAGPLWIVMGWGILVFLYGLYRTVRGPSSLDHERGGTDANGR